MSSCFLLALLQSARCHLDDALGEGDIDQIRSQLKLALRDVNIAMTDIKKDAEATLEATRRLAAVGMPVAA